MAFPRSRQSSPEVRQWRAPRLNLRVSLFNDPEDTNQPEVRVWAHRRDVQANVAQEEGATAFELRTLFTVRYREGIAANVTIVDDIEVFEATGLPQMRGGEGRYAKRWLVIECVRRE